MPEKDCNFISKQTQIALKFTLFFVVKAVSSGWKRKEKLVKIIRKELEKKIRLMY